MNTDNMYCIMDDVDVEYNTPIVLTKEQEKEQEQIEKTIIERHPELFK